MAAQTGLDGFFNTNTAAAARRDWRTNLRTSNDTPMVDELTDDLWRQLVHKINECPSQGGSKAVTSVIKLCHEANLTYVNKNPDSLGDEAQIQSEFRQVAALLTPDAMAGRNLQDSDKENAMVAQQSMSSMAILRASLLTEQRSRVSLASCEIKRTRNRVSRRIGR
jgi:hypothetical protein